MFNFIFTLILIIGLVLLTVWIVRQASSGGYGVSSKSSSTYALEILDERFAKGEISKEEYEEKRRDLTKS